MEYGLARNWWALALRGVAAIAFGILAFLWPGFAWLVIALTWGVYVFMDGVLAIYAAAVGHGHGGQWWALLFEGVFGILAGLVTFFWPGLTEVILLYVIAAWAIATGVMEMVAAIRLRTFVVGEWALVVSGMLSLLFGLVLILAPVAGALAVAWLIGGYAIAFGVLLLMLALRLRGMTQQALPGTRV